jgi:hypothetical protein
MQFFFTNAPNILVVRIVEIFGINLISAWLLLRLNSQFRLLLRDYCFSWSQLYILRSLVNEVVEARLEQNSNILIISVWEYW